MAQTSLQPHFSPTGQRPSSPRNTRRSFFTRLLQGLRSWFRQTFSRDSILTSLKSLAWVAPMTVFIWVYAEREQIAKQSITFRVEVRNTDPASRIIEVPDDRVTAEFSGPQALLEQVKEVLESGSGTRVVDAPAELPPGKNRIDLVASLTNDSLFVKNGLTVSNLSPKQLTITVDPIEHRPLEVRTPTTAANLDGPAVFEPANVAVSGPKSVLDQLDSQGKLLAYAAIHELKEPGPQELHGVPVMVSNDPRITVSPATVSANLKVKISEEGIVKAMPVWAIYPPIAQWDKYKAVYDPNIFDVKVTGPAEMIKKINDSDFDPRPKAYFDVTTASKSGANPLGTQYTADLHFDFGATGVKTDEKRQITFTVVERKPAE